MSFTTYDTLTYYPGLLILQYIGKPRARATIQAVTVPIMMPQTSVQVLSIDIQPNEGSYQIFWGDIPIGPPSFEFSWDQSTADLQEQIRRTSGLENIVVTGTFADFSSDGKITITFTGVPQPVEPLSIAQNGMADSGLPVTVTVYETDETLPLAVENGFNLIGDNIAVGVQLDTLGKYVGVVRQGLGFYQNIVLDDADFLSLIKMAIIKNSSGSSLATIQELLFEFFSGAVLVFDYQNMQMSFLISWTVGSYDLIQMFVTQGLLPVPMAVGYSVIYAPIIDSFFGFCDYFLPVPLANQSPFNTYEDYHTDYPWIGYESAVISP